MRMSKLSRVALGFGLFGLATTVALYVSIPYTNYIKPSKVTETFLGIMAACLCPPGLLSIAFFDIEPYSAAGATLWCVIALINTGLYTIVGRVVGKLSLRADETDHSGNDSVRL